jgi:hypothetical protein
MVSKRGERHPWRGGCQFLSVAVWCSDNFDGGGGSVLNRRGARSPFYYRALNGEELGRGETDCFSAQSTAFSERGPAECWINRRDVTEELAQLSLTIYKKQLAETLQFETPAERFNACVASTG